LSELAGVKWENIDFEEDMLTIDSQRMYVSNYGIFEKKPEANSGKGYIPALGRI